MFIVALTPPPVIDLCLAMFIYGCALRGLWGQWMGLEGLMGDRTEEHEANWAVNELKGGTWDCNSLAWELLNNSVCLL